MTREDELLKRYAAKQSQAAFAELVRRYLDFVYSICRRKLGDDALAQDVTQTVFLLLAEKAGSLKPGTALSGWLFRVAHHACQNALRVEARRRHYERKAVQEMDQAAYVSGQQRPLIESDLDDALAKLSAPDRNAVLLRYVEEMSFEEMATALGISAAAAHKRVSRALERLRGHFGQAGATLTVAAVGTILAEQMVQATPPAQAAAILGKMTASGLGSAGAGLGAVSHTALRGGVKLGLSKAQVAMAALLALALAGGWGVSPLRRVSQSRAASGRTGIQGVAVQYTTLRGRILDAGKPAPGVTVTLLRSEAATGLQSEFAQVQTDRAGNYTASHVPVGPDGWTIIADSGKSLGFGVPGRDCFLLPPTRLRLHLVTGDGRPAPRIPLQPLLLTLVGPGGTPVAVNLSVGCPARLKATSDAAGQVTFDGLPQGAVATFAVLDTRYVRRPLAADGLLLAQTSRSGDVMVPLPLGAVVEGQLSYGATGRPAAGVRIGAQQIGTNAWDEAVTGPDGRYRIAQLLPGRYNLAVDEESAALNGAWTANAIPALALRSSQNNPGEDLHLISGVLITGKVTQRGSGKPAAGVEIGAYGPAHPRTSLWVGGGWTDSDGRYEIRVPPGTQYVYPMSGASAGRGAAVVVPDGRDAVVDFAVPPP